MPLPEGFNTEYPECPTCGGGMYDNRTTKKSDKQPDFKCKDKECGKALWIAAKGASRPAKAGTPATPAPAPLTPEQKKAGRDKVFADYFGLMQLTAERMGAIAKERGLVLHMENVQAATYSVYALLDKKRYLSDATVKAKPQRIPSPPPEPPRRAPEPEYEPFEDPDELPF